MDHEKKHPYDDILYLPHHTSATRPRMPALDRAAQFSPFAALTGYDDVIQETARLTDRPADLDENRKEFLNEKLQMVAEMIEERPEITLTYFEPDERKTGGAYVSVTGRVEKLDEIRCVLVLKDGTAVSFSQIYELESGRFHSLD